MEKIWFLLMSFVHYLTASIIMATPTTNLATDQSALLTLKAHIAPNNILAYNWSNTSSSTSCCNWIGVTCGIRHQRVASLNLSNMGLSGTIPPHLGNLSFLSLLDMGNNSLHGHIPDQLSSLRRLKIIDLSDNLFSDELPSWLDHLPNLKFLGLSYNNFSGTIPPSIGNNSNLEELRITNNQIHGYIPKEIGRLSRLRKLYLWDNQLSGSIPSSIYNISSLQHLDLSNNNLSGSFPANMCRHLPRLEILYLPHNQLYGDIPSTVRYCNRLQELVLHVNRFTGTIPKEIGNLTRLEILALTGNSFKGVIPEELGKLHNLREMHFHNNGLSGSIPWNIFNISTLEVISLSNNQLSGQLPYFRLPNLVQIYLWRNKLSGIIPESISNSSRLTLIELSYNSFTGFIPSTLGNLRLLEWFAVTFNSLSLDSRFFSSLTNCRKLRSLQISNNSWNDNILPISIGNISSSLETFLASNCNFKGHLPREIGNLSNLITLSLPTNKLTGPIPSTIGRLQKLQYLAFSDNKLQGSIPYDLCHLRSLVYLSLNENELSGPIPACIGNLTSLLQLQLNSNKLMSTIPSTLTSLTNIVVLDLSLNSLTGNLPLDIGSLKMLSDINISMNHLSGNIPNSIGSFQSLVNLTLAHNKLQGPIPLSFEDLISLEFLDLSDNNLSGAIPKSFEKLRYLKILNVSSNRLHGEIPNRGPFTNLSAESFMLNDALCGEPRFKVPPCKTAATSRRSRRKVFLVLRYALPPAIVITMLVLLLVLIRRRKMKVRTATQTEILPLPWRRISFQQIVKASNGFSETNLLGKGSFGSVYRGILLDGVNIAVKVFNLQLEGAFKSFDVECEVLRNIRHRNLIKIISSCSNNLDFKALVLEYMPNGSLEKWLYSHNYFLDILQRLNIMIDVALALEYLHHDYSTPIIHCDLKPSNILLDEDMVAHVGDFGISKLLGEGEFMKQTITVATIGYMAPEYGTEGIVSTKGDVFSYGIILMETFIRKKPTDESFTEEMNLKRLVSDSVHDSIIEVVDSNLLGREEEHFVAKEQCLSSALVLALKCCSDSPEERINMKDIIVGLRKIKNKLLASTGGA